MYETVGGHEEVTIHVCRIACSIGSAPGRLPFEHERLAAAYENRVLGTCVRGRWILTARTLLDDLDLKAADFAVPYLVNFHLGAMSHDSLLPEGSQRG